MRDFSPGPMYNLELQLVNLNSAQRTEAEITLFKCKLMALQAEHYDAMTRVHYIGNVISRTDLSQDTIEEMNLEARELMRHAEEVMTKIRWMVKE